MMSQLIDPVREQALEWAVRVDEHDFQDWAAFTTWLDRDPAHAAAYDRIVADEAQMVELLRLRPAELAMPAPAWSFATFRPGRRAVGALAAAASVLLVVGYGARGGETTYAVETPPGARMAISLADGSRAELNGGTRLLLDRGSPRTARLERGEATFTVVHDDARPFEVVAGRSSIRDVGTVFNVLRQGGVTDVAVAEGEVLFEPSGAAIRLKAGQTLHAPDSDPVATLGWSEPANVASWRRRRLVYRGVGLTQIASDLERNLGVRVRTSADLSPPPFTGTIALAGNSEQILARLGPLLDFTARRDEGGWLLTRKIDADDP